MLALRLFDKFIDLGSAKITLTIRNAIFDPELISRSYSFPFRVPASPHNDLMLHFIRRLDARHRVLKKADIYVSNSFFKNGNLTLKSATEKDYELYFQSSNIQFWEDLEKIKVNELLDTIEVPLLDEVPRWEFLPETSNGLAQGFYQIIYKEQTFSHLSGLGSGETAADVSSIFATAINAAFPGTAYVSSDTLVLDAEPGDPPLVDFSGLQQMELTFQFTFAERNHNSFITYANSLMANPDDRFCFPTINASKFYEDPLNYIFRGKINPVQEGVYVGNNTYDNQAWESTYVPMIFLKKVMERIADAAGYDGVIGSFTDLQEYDELIIFNNRTLDSIAQAFFETKLKYLNQFRTSFDLNQHLPDETGKEFMLSLAEKFGFIVGVRDNKIVLDLMDPILSKSSLDITDHTFRKYKKTLPQKTGYIFRDLNDSQESYSDPNQLNPYIEGKGENVYETAWGTLHMDEIQLSNNAQALVPTTFIKAYSEAADMKYTHGKKLLLYKGLQKDSEGFLYPMATHGTVNYSGEKIGSLSLDWNGPEGLFTRLHRILSRYRFGPIVDITLVPASPLLLNLLKPEKLSLSFYHPSGSTVGLINQVKAQISNREIKSISISLKTL